MEYYSQEGQDSVLMQFFKQKGITNGFFLDVGSVDGLYFSNTYLLELNGWSGICIEAHPTYAKMLKENRKAVCYSCAAGDEDKDVCEFNSNYRGSLSTLDFELEKFYNSRYKGYYGDRNKKEIDGAVNGKIEIPMRKIDSILDENNVKAIDLMTIDIDGSEKFAFKGLTLSKWNPTLLVVEWSIVGDIVKKYAIDNGYHFGINIGADSIYCRDINDVDILKNLRVQGTKIEMAHPSEKLK